MGLIDHFSNLPLQLTSFVGREQELADVLRLLSTTRLLTLTGAGGVGKTRLALSAATDVQQDYADGVCLAQLAALTDPALIPRTVAAALGVGETRGQPLQATLASYLKARHLLLVLDNCEHLAAACAELVDALLSTCPALRILATSRQRLRLPGETAWRVPSLTTPDARAPSGTDELSTYGAVRLFVERAQAVQSTFRLGDRNARAVAQICQRLDGIPLALELAASRVLVLAPEQILNRLDDCFSLLVGGSHLAPTRQQTLRATLDWSYGLLSSPEQTLFRRLSVFAGGFTIDAAEAVCADTISLPRPAILDLLSALVDKSLVTVDATDSAVARYALLQTLRQYALERLTEPAERAELRRRHALHFLALVEQAQPHLGDAQQGPWLDRLEREHDNFRAALQWSVEHTEPDTGVRIAGALYRLWFLRGYVREGRRWFEQVLASSPEAPTAARARALRGAGLLAYAEGDYPAARAQTEQALVLARALEDRWLIAAAANNLGIILIDIGEYAAARACCAEGLALARALADDSLTAVLLNNLGLIAVHQADYQAAVPLLEESLAISQARGIVGNMAWSTGNLGNAAYYQGDFTTAHARYRQSLSLAVEVGDKRIIAERLEELAWVACAYDQLTLAARLFGAAEVLRETIGAPMPPANRAAYERAVARARAGLGATALATTWEHGRALPLDQAIAQALAIERTPAPADPAGPLTPREREVAVLVARGLGNRDIASALVLSIRTVEAHVTHLLTKLNLRSRAQLALWVVEHGLRADQDSPDAPSKRGSHT